MSFDRQLDILMGVLATLIAFVGCIFVIGLPIEITLLISACVFLAGLLLGGAWLKLSPASSNRQI
jgi:hypothetical protein